MIRRAFTMKLKPGKFDEYKHHHDNIWPELVSAIEASGIASFTTFEREGLLFLYSEIHDEEAWDRLWHTEIHTKWGNVMEPLMNIGPDGIVEAFPVTEIFHYEPGAFPKA